METLFRKNQLQMIKPVYQNPHTGRALFEVRNTNTGLLYALKKLPLEKNTKIQIKREINILNKIPFGQAAHCHQILEDKQSVYLLMDWIVGQPMSERYPQPPTDERELIMRLSALEKAALRLFDVHKARLYHRDIKPENIIVQSRQGGVGNVFLIDFGLSAQHRESQEGTLGYRAPEQDIMRDKNLTAATDVFSLGQVGWFLISGSPRKFEYNSDYSGWEEDDEPLYPAFVPFQLVDVFNKATEFKENSRFTNVLMFHNGVISSRKKLEKGGRR